MEWIIANKAWLFDGIAVAVPIAVITWFFTKKDNKQSQKGGKNSTNIQVGGNFKIGSDKEDKDDK